MKKILIMAGLLLAALHQDFWNWDRSDLVLGWLPVGLAYHVAYTLVVAAFWALVVTLAWPAGLERAGNPDQTDTGGGGGRA